MTREDLSRICSTLLVKAAAPAPRAAYVREWYTTLKDTLLTIAQGDSHGPELARMLLDLLLAVETIDALERRVRQEEQLLNVQEIRNRTEAAWSTIQKFRERTKATWPQCPRSASCVRPEGHEGDCRC